MKSIVAISLFLTLVIGCQKEAQIGILIDLNGTFKDTLYLSYLKTLSRLAIRQRYEKMAFTISTYDTNLMVATNLLPIRSTVSN
jgi:hypothetical protein